MRYFKFWIGCLCLLGLFNPAALAQPTWTKLQSVLEAQSNAVPVSSLADEDAQLPLRSLGNLPEMTAIEQVASMNLRDTKPFNPDITQPMQPGQALWLHFRLTADHPDMATGWLLEFTRPFVDRVELYSPNGQKAWKMQAAGDFIAHSQWPMRSLNPQFALPTLTPGAHDFYIRVANTTPLRFAVNLQRADVMHTKNQHQFLWLGLLLGFMALMAIASLLMALTYRNPIYLLYTLIVGVSFIACASFAGMASYAFWRHAAWWPEFSTNVLLMATTTLQTQFCRAIFYTSTTAVWRQRAITGLLIVSVLCIAMAMITPVVPTRVVLINLVLAVNALAIAIIVLRALYQGSLTAKLWLLAYLPLGCIVFLAIVDTQGWLPFPWLSYNAPLYALMFEMPVLLVALHLHAKTQHTSAVRQTTLADLDPLTGFVASEHFPRLLAQHWSQAQIEQRDIAVAYVRPLLDPSYAPLGIDPPTAQQATLRTVRLLRTVAFANDHVACVKPNLYALIMPQAPVKADIKQRLSRLVALGMMTDTQGHCDIPIRFRIAVGTLNTYSGMWHELDAALQEKITKEKGWDRRTIRYVSKRYERDWDSADLSDFWDKALDAEAIHRLATHNSTVRATTAPSRPG
jgi:hypothetical protein